METDLIGLADNVGVLILSLYIIQNGMAQMRELTVQYNQFVQTVLTQQQANNQSLADLVKDLCQR